MKLFAAVSAIVAVAVGVQAIPLAQPKGGRTTPIARADNDTSPFDQLDIEVVQYIVTIENMSSAFYKEALNKYGEMNFTDASLSADIRTLYGQVAAHEDFYAAFYTAFLQDAAPQPCEYNFPHNSVIEFAKLSAFIEQAAASGITGALRHLNNKDLVDTVSDFAALHSKHASWIDSQVLGRLPWQSSQDALLSPRETLAFVESFTVACPTSNPDLFGPPLSSLSFTSSSNNNQSSAAPGSEITFDFDSEKLKDVELTAIYHQSLPTLAISAPVFANGTSTVPLNLAGTVFVVLTANATSDSDDDLVAGTAVMYFGVDLEGHFIP